MKGKDEVASSFSNNQTYFFCVMPGNYPASMRTVMTKRGNWQEVRIHHKVIISEQVSQEEALDQCQYIWRPVNFGFSVSLC